MPVVQGPDGQIIDFPDTMSEAQINAAMAQQYGGAKSAPPASSPLPTAVRVPLSGLSSILGGIESAIGLPGTIENLAQKFLPIGNGAPAGRPTSIGDTFGQWLDQGGPMGRLPSGQDIQGVSNALGLTNNPALAPQSSPERYFDAAASGLGGALPFGGAPLQTIGSGIASGLGAEFGHQMDPSSAAAPIWGALLGGVGAGSALGTVDSALQSRAAQKAADAASLALEKAKNDAFYGRNSNAENATAIKSASADQFAAAKAAAQARAQAIADHADSAVQTTAASLGKSTSLQEAGQVLQSQARNWISNVLPAKQAEAWAPVDALVPSDTTMELPAFQSALAKINKSAGALEPLAQLMKPSLPARLQSTLKQILNPEEEIPGEAPTPPLITWANVQKLRSTLGDAMGNNQIVNDVGRQNLAHLYATLTGDMGAVARKLGAGDEFSAANAESTRLFNLAEGPFGKIISTKNAGQETIKPEDAAKALLAGAQKGGSDISALRGEVPGAVDELAAAHLRQGDKAWTGLSPEGRVALVTDQAKASTIDTVLGAKAAAQAEKGAAIAAAQETHQANVAQATQGARTGNFSLAENTRNAALAYAKAKNALSPRPTLMQNAAEGISGGMLGDWLGTIGLHMLPGSDLTHGAIGGIAGIAGPALVRGLATASSRPQTYRNLLATGSVMANPLAGQ